MKNILSLKSSLSGLLLVAVAFTANAQTLPNVQKEGVRAPANVKIDGKATEWNNKFAAYNKATDVYYTLANDDDNLYLVIRSKYHEIVDKILRGGITLTINHTLSKKDNGRVLIKYPFFTGRGQSDVANMLGKKEIEKTDAKGGDIQVDDMNKVFGQSAKTIKVYGIKDIADEDLSIYNQEGIKAASLFDKQLVYTYELSIPLKYLNLPNNGIDGFSYNIKVNEPADAPLTHLGGPPPPPMTMTSTAATDFWGEYVLAKK